jgi:hypothetical protein
MRLHRRCSRSGVSAAAWTLRPLRAALPAPPARRQKRTHEHSVPTQ